MILKRTIIEGYSVQFIYEKTNEAGQIIGQQHTGPKITPQMDISELPDKERAVVEFARIGYIEPEPIEET
jgi:hypothetical protein